MSRNLSDMTQSSGSPLQLLWGFQVSLCALYQQQVSGLFETRCIYDHSTLSAINPARM